MSFRLSCFMVFAVFGVFTNGIGTRRPQPQKYRKLVFLIEVSRPCTFLNWLSGAPVGVGGSDFIGYVLSLRQGGLLPTTIFSAGGMIRLEPSSSSNFSIRAFRAYPPCRIQTDSSLSGNSRHQHLSQQYPPALTPGSLIKKPHIKKFRGWISVKKHNFLTRGKKPGFFLAAQKNIFFWSNK